MVYDVETELGLVSDVVVFQRWVGEIYTCVSITREESRGPSVDTHRKES